MNLQSGAYAENWQVPTVTIAICTLDRVEQVRTCLSSLERQTTSPSDFEVLVVDNGPSDQIAALTRDFSHSRIKVRYVKEPRRGLTYARRRAWKQANGQIVGYIDDDAVAHPSWVAAAVEAFERGGRTVAMVGGPVLDVESLSEPWPFTDAPGSSGLDLGQERRALQRAENLWGCNFLFRRDALVALDAFGEPLGHRDGHPGANEDIIVQRQLDRAGLVRLYDPSVQIVHDSWRASATWRQRQRLAFHTGTDNAIMERLLGANSWSDRYPALKAQAVRLRTQVAAAYRQQRAHSAAELTQTRMAVMQTLGTIYGWSWPILRPESKPQD